MPAIFASGAVRNDDGSITPVVDAPVPGDTMPPDAAGQSAPSDTPEVVAQPEPAPGEPPALEESEEDAVDTLFAQPEQRPNRPFVARLLRENQSFKDRLADLEAQNRILIQRMQAAPPAAPEAPAAPPVPPLTARREDYPDDASYVSALVQMGVSQELQRREAETTVRTMAQRWESHVQAGHTKYPDFDQALANPQAMVVPTLQSVLFETVSESEVGADLLYYLGTHPQDVHRLNSLSPIAASRYLGRLEAQLAPPVAPPAARAPVTPPVRPAVPRPLPPTQGSGAPAPMTGFRPGMPLADYEAMRTQQRAGRR